MNTGGPTNGILKEFLDMRRNIHKQHQTTAAATESAKQTGKRNTATKTPLIDELTEISLATIIEDKPKKAVVCEYFQKMADRLTREKMK
jgi:hypothetical protein